MNPEPDDLRRRILAFDIDGPDVPALSFVARLARENGWDRAFADRVVAEYRRFLVLAATADHPVTPSDAVDQAWHLHLTYTRSYWDRLCGEVLEFPLHHDPTRGGPVETDKFRDQYEATRLAYRRAFGEEPPADIWPPAGMRPGAAPAHVRVNTCRYWLVPKPARRLAAVAVLAVVVGLLAGCGPGVLLDADGGPSAAGWFVGLWLVGFAGALVLARYTRHRLTNPTIPEESATDPALDRYDLAYLAGGAVRVYQAAATRLVEVGSLTFDAKRYTLVAAAPLSAIAHPAEREVYEWARTGGDGGRPAGLVYWSSLRQLDTLFGHLTGAGLAIPSDRVMTAWAGPFMIVFVYLVLAFVTAFVLNLPARIGRPGALLVPALVLTGVGLVVTFVLFRRQPVATRRGENLLAARRVEVRSDEPRVRTGPPPSCRADMGLAVALFGAGVLQATTMSTLTAELQPPYGPGKSSWTSGGDSSSGSSGGSGCGGGGGGCGGGGGGCGGGG